MATAAHVIQEFPKTRYAVLTPATDDRALKIVRGGLRGGRKHDPDDVGWLEFSPGAAAKAGRSFLPISRIRPFCDGTGENLCVYGAPAEDAKRGMVGDVPSYTSMGSMWATRSAHEWEIGEKPDRARKLYLYWPRRMPGHNGTAYDFPHAPGISGGGIWALNGDHGEQWRADLMQLVGVEYAWRPSGVPERHMVGFQMQEWLRMVAEDVPELKEEIDAHLRGASVQLVGSKHGP